MYIIQYYDNLKAQVDIYFENKLQSIQNIKLKDENNKEWIECIEIIDKFYAKCMNTIRVNQ